MPTKREAEIPSEILSRQTQEEFIITANNLLGFFVW